jgi:hypothetical protein
MMKRTLVVAAMLLSFVSAGATQQTPAARPRADALAIEANVRKLWDAFKNKDKATLSSLLDDGFRQFEEGLTTFGDKKAEVNAPDEYDLLSYALSDFNVKATGPNSAVVTYIAQYEGKSGGQVAKAKSVFGEVWIRTGSQWKALYMQETYVK